MLRKLLLIAVLLAFFAPATSLAGGGFVEEQMIQEPLVAHSTEKHDGMSNEVLAALIAGGLGLTGAVITAIVSLNSRRNRKE
jgi:hypothetical protein